MLFFKYGTVLLLVSAIVMPQTSCRFLLPPDAGAPPIEVKVHQREGEVSFEFFAEDTILLFIPHRIRIGVDRLFVKDPKGETIWSIRFSKADPAAVAREVRYGVVPEGFSQLAPKQGDAPGLKNAEYEVSVRWGVVGGRTTFIYQGAKAP